MDRACIDVLIDQIGIKDIFDQKYEHYALVEFSSSRHNDNLQLLLEDSIAAEVLNKNVDDAIVASNETQVSHFWNLRETLPGVLKNIGEYVTFDISVPISLLPELIINAKKVCNRICKNSRVFVFGHIGDGNIHYYLFKPQEISIDEFLNMKSKIKSSIYDITAKLDGSFSAEHGIGVAKKQELKYYTSEVEIELMKVIKKSLDPNNIMNPGKVL
jgi:FAD/FMN-containing dehydrogenase